MLQGPNRKKIKFSHLFYRQYTLMSLYCKVVHVLGYQIQLDVLIHRICRMNRHLVLTVGIHAVNVEFFAILKDMSGYDYELGNKDGDQGKG
jgi:hypothetical protein